MVDRNSEEPSPNATISSGGEERPAVKRKIEFSLGESPCNLDELVDFMHELGDTGTDDNIIGSDLSFEDFDISEPSLNLPTPPTYLYSGMASQGDISNISPISTHGSFIRTLYLFLFINFIVVSFILPLLLIARWCERSF